MDIELQKKLFENYPNLFENAKKTIYESCMAWGITTGDGWFKILKELCEELSKLNGNVKFDQIKEKFGLLRIYYSCDSGLEEQVNKLISKAEYKSSLICENCGEPGTRDGNSGWITTLCDNCNKKFEESNSE